MRINTNISALNTHRMMGITHRESGKNLEKLSSGKRLNRSSDDAAGLAISEKMHAQIRGLRMASKNSLDGMSLIQTAEGALNEVHAMLQRMRELAVQAANDTNQAEDRKAMKDEIDQLKGEIERIGANTEFNKIKMFAGSAGTNDPVKVVIQNGANENQMFEIQFDKLMTVSGVSSLQTIAVDNQGNANTAISTLDTAINKVSDIRSKLGAYQNRLEKAIANLDNTAENLTAAQSRIADTDMALEMSEFTKLNIMQQAGTAMLAQANQQPQMLLKLLNA